MLIGSISIIPGISGESHDSNQENDFSIEIHSTFRADSSIVDFIYNSEEDLTLTGFFCQGNQVGSQNCSATIDESDIDSMGGTDVFLHVIREDDSNTLVIGSEGDDDVVQILESEFGFWIIGDFCGGIETGSDCSLSVGDSITPTEGGRDIFILAFNHQGNLISMETFGTEGDDTAGRGVIDGSSNLIFTGGISNASMDLAEDCFILPTSVSRGILFRFGLTDGLTWAGVMTPVGGGNERAIAHDVLIERIGDESWRAIVVGETSWRYNSWRNCGQAWVEHPKAPIARDSGIYIGELQIEVASDGTPPSAKFTQDVYQDIVVFSEGNNSANRIEKQDDLMLVSGTIHEGDLLPRLLAPSANGDDFIWTIDSQGRLVHSLLLSGTKISGFWTSNDSTEHLQIGVDCALKDPCETRLDRDLYFDRFSERVEDSRPQSNSFINLDDSFTPNNRFENLNNRSTLSFQSRGDLVAFSGSARGADSNFGYFHSSGEEISPEHSNEGYFGNDFVVATAITTGVIVAISASQSFRGLTLRERILAILAISGKTPRWRMDQGEETRNLILSQFEEEATELTVNRIAQNCGLTRSQVYHHLSILIKDGILLETNGGYTKYKLNPNFLADEGGII